MTLDPTQAKYAQLREHLKQEIFMGRMAPGSRVPSENTLAAELGMSRHTVRKAISQLVADGFLYTEQGRGTFVRDRSLRRNESRNIGVITTYISEYIFPQVIQGIDRVLSDNGYSIVLKSTGNQPEKEAQCLADMLEKQIEGLIIEPTKSALHTPNLKLYQALEAQGIPYLFIHGHHVQLEDKPEILLNDEEGMHRAVTHLVELGHRRIAGFFKADDVQGLNRHKGYAHALADHGIIYDPELVVWFHTEDRETRAVAALAAMLRGAGKVDALACYNDQLAAMLVKWLMENGYRIPQDISVTGFDDSFLATGGPVALTSVSHPKERLGETAAQWMLDMLGSGMPQETERHRVIEPELIVRASTGPCPNRNGLSGPEQRRGFDGQEKGK